MKKTLTLFLFYTLVTNTIYSQTSIIEPCNTDTIENENIEIHLVFDKNTQLIKSAITSIPANINCNSYHYVVTTIDNESSETIEEIVIENIQYTNRSEPIISGGVVPIIISPIPPKDCIKATSLEPIPFDFLDNIQTNTPKINFSIKNKIGSTLKTIEKELETTNNIGELEILNVKAKLDNKIDIRWDIINYGCNLKTPFTSSIYGSRDSILSKNDLLIVKRKTRLSYNRTSEHVAILNHHQLAYFKYVIIKIDSNDEIIETNEFNNLKVLKIRKNDKPPIIVYSGIEGNTIDFMYKTEKKTPVSILIYNQSGILKTTKHFTNYSKDHKSMTLSLNALDSGLYFYKITTNTNTYSGNLVKK